MLGQIDDGGPILLCPPLAIHAAAESRVAELRCLVRRTAMRAIQSWYAGVRAQCTMTGCSSQQPVPILYESYRFHWKQYGSRPTTPV